MKVGEEIWRHYLDSKALKGKDTLVWMDLEMTGLNPDVDRIIEMATIITDGRLNLIAEGPELVIHQPDSILDQMDEWNKNHHGSSGLIQKVKKSHDSMSSAENKTLEFIKTHVKENQGILAGNSIWQDRRFLIKYMKKLDSYLHYRMLDVSTIKILASNWYEEKPFKKKEMHRAKLDILESLEELKYYQKKCFK